MAPVQMLTVRSEQSWTVVDASGLPVQPVEVWLEATHRQIVRLNRLRGRRLAAAGEEAEELGRPR